MSENYRYKIRPFVLSNPRGFLSKSYGVKNGQVYAANDILGLIRTGWKAVDLKDVRNVEGKGILSGKVMLA